MRFRVFAWPIIAGATIGLAVWHLDAPASLALLLPFIWLRAGTRLAGAGAVLAYYLAGAYDLIDAARMFFGQSILVGLAAWLGQAVILSIPWLLLWAPANAPGRPWRVAAVLVTTAVPPIGLFNWLSPLLAAGDVLPAAGLWGLVGTILLSTLLATWPQWKLNQWTVLLGVATIMTVQLVAAVTPRGEPPAGVGGINTAMGVLPPTDRTAQFHRVQAVKEVISNVRPGTVTILPEGIVGRWRPAVQYWLGADRAGGTVLLGADVPTPDSEGGYLNALVDARTGAVVASARIPMPVALWKPWAPAESARVAPWGSGLTRIAGHPAAISFCYEDFLLWPQLLSLPRHPEVLVSVANNWFVRDGSHSANIQARSIALMARIFGVPLVRAVNYLPSSAPSTEVN